MNCRILLQAAGLASWLGLLAAGCGAAAADSDGTVPTVTATPAASIAVAEAQADSPLVLVAYFSQTGMTQRMAVAVAEGAREIDGVQVVLSPIDSVRTADLVGADGIVLGSPTHWANMATPMRAFIDGWPGLGLSARDRIGGAFATGGGSSGGKEMVVTSMLLAMLSHGMIVVGPIFREGDVEYGNFGVAAATGLMSSQSLAAMDLDAARALGRRVAEVVIEFRGSN